MVTYRGVLHHAVVFKRHTAEQTCLISAAHAEMSVADVCGRLAVWPGKLDAWYVVGGSPARQLAAQCGGVALWQPMQL
jgi:hypothetical protein